MDVLNRAGQEQKGTGLHTPRHDALSTLLGLKIFASKISQFICEIIFNQVFFNNSEPFPLTDPCLRAKLLEFSEEYCRVWRFSFKRCHKLKF